MKKIIFNRNNLIFIIIVQIVMKLIGVEFSVEIFNYLALVCVAIFTAIRVKSLFLYVEQKTWGIVFGFVSVLSGFLLGLTLLIWIYPNSVYLIKAPNGQEYSVIDKSFLFGTNIMIYRNLLIIRINTNKKIDTDDSYNPIQYKAYKIETEENGFNILYNYNGPNSDFDKKIFVPY